MLTPEIIKALDEHLQLPENRKMYELMLHLMTENKITPETIALAICVGEMETLNSMKLLFVYMDRLLSKHLTEEQREKIYSDNFFGQMQKFLNGTATAKDVLNAYNTATDAAAHTSGSKK